MHPRDWTVEYFLANEVQCTAVLENSDALQEIPSLNSASLDSFKNGQLVRFKGMLQDMYNPEYYFKNVEVTNTQTGEYSMRNGMYIDVVHCQPHEEILANSNKNENSQRDTWFVISTPGLNDWAKESSTAINQNTENMVSVNNISSSSSYKRPLNEIQESMDCSEPTQKKEKVSIDGPKASTSRSNEESHISPIVSRDHVLNFPIPNEDGKACIVKVYKESTYKLNDVLDIIGFLSLDPNLSIIHDSEDMVDDLERQTHHPPASMVPRLHVVKITSDSNKYEITDSAILPRAESIRGDLRVVLSQLLFGDEIAADYLICHLISSVYVLKDPLSLGAFSLNITSFPKQYANFTKEFYEILKQIVAKSHFIDITIENLNEMNLIPKKDYDCNRLTSGALQLSKNTHLVLDESGLTTGNVTECGKQNYKALSDVVQFQKVPYDFRFYNMEYDTDIPILILSETKSFVPCQTQIILQPDPEVVKIYPEVLKAAKLYLKDEARLKHIREYVNSLKHAKFEFTDEAANIIQEDFVRLRQAHRNFSVDNLHSLIVLSRLMSLSYGINSLKPEMWKRSVDMEVERMKRLP